MGEWEEKENYCIVKLPYLHGKLSKFWCFVGPLHNAAASTVGTRNLVLQVRLLRDLGIVSLGVPG